MGIPLQISDGVLDGRGLVGKSGGVGRPGMVALTSSPRAWLTLTRYQVGQCPDCTHDDQELDYKRGDPIRLKPVSDIRGVSR